MKILILINMGLIYLKRKCIRWLLFLTICFGLAIVLEGKTDIQNSRWISNYEQICQTDYTRMNYCDGYYYYQSSADHFYLYKSDEEGKEQECLTEQVPKEIYIKDDWIYFTNVSDKQTLYKIQTDGSEMEQILKEQIDRFIFIGDKIYYLSKEDGYLYSWQEGTESKLLYQGDCRWLGTDGRIPYVSVCETEGKDKNFFVISLDENGNLQSKINGFKMIPTEGYLYDVDDKSIITISTETGKATKLAEIPDRAEYESVIDFALWKGDIYVLCYQWEESYVIYQYKTSENKLEILYFQPIEDNDFHCREFEDFHIKNGKIFMKELAAEGKGELWYCLDITSREKRVFEDMEPFGNITIPLNEDVFCGAAEGSIVYLAQDYVYDKTIEDKESNLIKTNIVVPQMNENIAAYQEINRKILNEAESFYREQTEFAEYIKNAAVEWENESCGHWRYVYIYADDDYVSIVYYKFIGRNGLDDIKENHYEVRLYSAKTGEEIGIEDLFCVDFDKALLRFSFAIRKTGLGIRMFDDDLEVLERHNSDYMKSNYILTEDGIDVFFVEKTRTAVFHYIIDYEELYDIIK